MNYENILQLLIKEFPILKNELDEDDYISELPHCVFELILIPYVKELCKNKEKKELIKLGNILEQMATCDDTKVRELLNVSFLEPIVLADKDMLPNLKIYLGQKSLEELSYWMNRYWPENNG